MSEKEKAEIRSNIRKSTKIAMSKLKASGRMWWAYERTEEIKEKQRHSMLGKSSWNKGKHLSREHRRKIGEGNAGKQHSKETKKKLRIAAISNLQRLHKNVYPYYNPEACKLIEEYGQRHGFNFQHAENGGEFHIKELGYWVDGYDAEKNVVIEVDEPRHYRNGKLKTKDSRRQREIEQHLKCTFIRFRI